MEKSLQNYLKVLLLTMEKKIISLQGGTPEKYYLNQVIEVHFTSYEANNIDTPQCGD